MAGRGRRRLAGRGRRDAHEDVPVASAEQHASRLPLALTPNRQQSVSRDEGVTYPLPDSDPEIQRLLSQ
jgi:hypothetical protein